MARLSEEEKNKFTHWYYAHRGLHTKDRTVPENSRRAFRRAAEEGYGYELDVQLSRDGEVMVFHDDLLDRMCGPENGAPEGLLNHTGFIWEKDYSELSKTSLAGTEETIPTLREVLDILKDGKGPLIVELKKGPRNDELSEKTYAIMKEYPGVWCMESFHPMIVNWFRKNAPEVVRGQLATTKDDYGDSVPKIGAWFLSRVGFTFLNRPDFIAYRIGKRPKKLRRLRRKGTMIIAWTSRSIDTSREENDAIIFEQYRPKPRF